MRLSQPVGAGARARVVSLGYHEVTDDPDRSGFQRPGALPYKHSTAVFEAHLDEIAAAPMSAGLVSKADLTTGSHLLLTFDDGGTSSLRTAEVLCRRGWRGHFFIVTGLLGRRGFLNPAEVRDLRSCGHLIGSHSHTHPDIFRELSPERMATEWRASRDILADLLGEACETASVPGGDISAAVLRSGREAGFRHLFTSEPRLVPVDLGGCWVLGRLVVKNTVSLSHLRRRINFEGWHQELAARRVKEVARRTLPALYRQYVRWRTTPAAGKYSPPAEGHANQPST